MLISRLSVVNKIRIRKMLSKYGTFASILLKRSAASLVQTSRHNNVYLFRPSVTKFRRTYCTNNASSTDVHAKTSDQSFSNEILEVLDSPEIIGRDHKHYRYGAR